MKKLIGKAVVVATLLTSMGAAAAFSQSTTVTGVEVAPISSAQYSWVYLADVLPEAPACTSKTRVGILTSDPGAKEIFSAAQAGLLSGKPVKVQFTGACSTAVSGSTFPLINGIRLSV